MLVPIPDDINGVRIEFAATVNRFVLPSLQHLLCAAIWRDLSAEAELDRLYISSAADSHRLPSRHAMLRAVDISRINGKRMSTHYPHDLEVRILTDALVLAVQICGSTFVAREVFGPGPTRSGVKLKLGRPYPQVRDHWDHIHLSEGDREVIDGCPWGPEPPIV